MAEKINCGFWTGRRSVVKMTSATPIKILMTFLTEPGQIHVKYVWKYK